MQAMFDDGVVEVVQYLEKMVNSAFFLKIESTSTFTC